MQVKNMLGLVLVLMLLTTSVLGCTFRNPTPERREDLPDTPVPGQRSPLTEENRARRIEEYVGNFSQVKEVHVVAVSNIALIGVTFIPLRPEEIQETKEEIAVRIERDEPEIVEALITDDEDLVREIKDIAAALEAGKPVYEFWDPLSRIMQEIRSSTVYFPVHTHALWPQK